MKSSFLLTVFCVFALSIMGGNKSNHLIRNRGPNIKSIYTIYEYLDSSGSWIAYQERDKRFNERGEILLDNSYDSNLQLIDSLSFAYDNRYRAVGYYHYYISDSLRNERVLYDYDSAGKISYIKSYRQNGTLKEIEHHNLYDRWEEEYFDSLGRSNPRVIQKYNDSNTLIEIDEMADTCWIEARDIYLYHKKGTVVRSKHVSGHKIMTRSVTKYNGEGQTLYEADFSNGLIPFSKVVHKYDELNNEILCRYIDFENGKFERDAFTWTYDYDVYGILKEERYYENGKLFERTRSKIEYY